MDVIHPHALPCHVAVEEKVVLFHPNASWHVMNLSLRVVCCTQYMAQRTLRVQYAIPRSVRVRLYLYMYLMTKMCKWVNGKVYKLIGQIFRVLLITIGIQLVNWF